MKITYKNLCNIKYIGDGIWKDLKYHYYIERDSCKYCKGNYLTRIDTALGDFCSRYCSNNSLEKRKKVSNTMEGRKLSNETRKRMSISRIGDKNHQWRGGITSKPYCLIFRNKEWREIIYERDKDKFCWNPQCEGRGTKECFHHIDYDKKNCIPSNIIKICNSCNSQANHNMEWWEPFYRIIMEKRGL